MIFLACFGCLIQENYQNNSSQNSLAMSFFFLMSMLMFYVLYIIFYIWYLLYKMRIFSNLNKNTFS